MKVQKAFEKSFFCNAVYLNFFLPDSVPLMIIYKLFGIIIMYIDMLHLDLHYKLSMQGIFGVVFAK